jgi:multiple sugar transport system permease protein
VASGSDQLPRVATRPAGRARGDRLASWLDRHAAWILPAPAVLAVVVLLCFPLGYTVYLSFTKWFLSAVSQPEFVGFDNYVRLARDERVRNALVNTFWFTFLAVVTEMLIGFGLAMLFNRDFRLRGLLRTFMLIPMMSTPIAVSLVWALMYEPTLGVFNYLLGSLGVPPLLFLGDRNLVIPALVAVDVWFSTPFVMLVLLAGLSSLPGEPYEAALIDGASSWQTLIFLTLPLLRPTIVVTLLFRTISALQSFDHIFALTGGGPNRASETINLLGYFQMIESNDMGYASTILIVLFAIVFGAALMLLKLRR